MFLMNNAVYFFPIISKDYFFGGAEAGAGARAAGRLSVIIKD